MSKFKEVVLSYYDFVDSNALEELFSLFSENIVYYRCEEKIEGIENFKKFYLNERKISGKHRIDQVILSDLNVVVCGVFSGDHFSFKFCDIFHFDFMGKIDQRDTFLASGYDKII